MMLLRMMKYQVNLSFLCQPGHWLCPTCAPFQCAHLTTTVGAAKIIWPPFLKPQLSRKPMGLKVRIIHRPRPLDDIVRIRKPDYASSESSRRYRSDLKAGILVVRDLSKISFGPQSYMFASLLAARLPRFEIRPWENFPSSTVRLTNVEPGRYPEDMLPTLFTYYISWFWRACPFCGAFFRLMSPA